MSGITLDSLGALRDHGYRLMAWCRCGHSPELDLEPLIGRFGAGFNQVAGREQLLGALVCSECGRHPYDLMLMPKRQWAGTGDR